MIPLSGTELTVSTDAIDVALALADRGIAVGVSPAGRLTFAPEHRLTIADRMAVGRHRDDLLRIAIYVRVAG